MEFHEILKLAFEDELEKIAAARKRMTVAQSRKGRRPMSVSTMLRKEKEGTMWKDTKIASSEGSEQGSLEYREGKPDPGAAKPKKRKGEIPSREGGPAGPKSENRQDAQGFLLETDAYNKPAEYA